MKSAAKQPFYNKQLEISLEASGVSATLAYETNEGKWKQARQRFWELYWGRLVVVEEGPVIKEMVSFGMKIPYNGKVPKLPHVTLAKHSFDLAKAVRKQSR